MAAEVVEMLTREENELLTKTGPGTPMGDLLRRYWLPAMLSEELPAPDAPPVRLKLLSEPLVAFRDTNGKIGIVETYCPHRGANLYWGRNEEAGLRCVYHGWKYDVNGICVDMPNEPEQSTFKDRISIVAYPTREAGGVVWLYMGPKELEPEMPELEWTLVPENQRYVHKRIQHNNYLQNVEGEIDSAHVSFLHRTLKQNELGSVLGQSLLQRQTDAAPQFSVRDTDYGVLVGARRNHDDEHYYWRITQFLMPSYTMIPAEPGFPVSFTGAVPVDDESMWGYTVTWHPDRPLSTEEVGAIESWKGIYTRLVPGTYESALNMENEYGIDRELQRTSSYTGIHGIREQDLAVQEDQWGPITDRTREHLGTTDLAVIAMRRRLTSEVLALQEGKEPPAASNGAAYRVRSAAFVTSRETVWYEADEAKEWMDATAKRGA
jgi:phenylpropionate dioxygenase-like ring-hydroxylating dioxygenase large terminal subunit